ncbi:hypothetical protein L6452_32309 [Arctium lappa]|uniref:Uncharacterized protein n=1 Tax=Arctium lappa TaxID=4217 RepID=A0ACB8Z548_ARCLA|nr:hypothetical protein L6452_32309 [Arctium lappa]
MEFERKFSSKQKVTVEPTVEKPKSIASPVQTATGIYTSWNVAETAVKRISSVKHKKYKSYEEARFSANIYTAAVYKAPLELISSSEGLRPSFSTVLTREKYSKIIVGTIPRKFQHTTQENIRRHGGLQPRCYIYRNAVKTYKKKCLKGTDKEIFLKIQSSFIFWDDQEEPIQTYKYVQIGVCKDKIYAPSQAKDTLLEKKDLQEIAEQKLLVLINKVFDIRREDKLKVNLATHYCLMTSFSTSSISEVEYKKTREFQKQLVSPFGFGSHYPSLCKKIKIELEKKSINHICQRCDPTTKAKGVMVD